MFVAQLRIQCNFAYIYSRNQFVKVSVNVGAMISYCDSQVSAGLIVEIFLWQSVGVAVK